jgi:FkbM family methyltransferase
MYKLLRKWNVVLSDIEFLLSPEYRTPGRSKLFRDYLRIRIKASLNRWFHFKQERFLSYSVTVPDYDIFFVTFRQVFVHRTYYCEIESGSPRIIDCGGNIGMSVLYWKYLYPEARITVFEPSREVKEILKENIGRNNLADIEVVEAALSGEDGHAEIYIRGTTAVGNTLKLPIWETTQTKGDDVFYTVPTKRLSPYITEPLDILKLDVEGNEGIVLQDLAASGALKYVQECVMEYHYYPAAADNSLADILAIFKKNGMEAQFYFEENSTSQQLALSHSGSYAVSIKSVRASSLPAKETFHP